MKKSVCVAAACWLFLAAPAVAADDCTLHELAALKMKSLSGGTPTVPITLDGKPAWFVFSLSDPFSYVKGSYADAAGFVKRAMPTGVSVLIVGHPAAGLEIVPSFAIGNASGKNLQLLRAETLDFGDAEVVGLLGMDILSSFDIELDASNQTANLFTHDHCDDKVVYWPTDRYAKVPYRTDPSGHPMFDMQLDGKKVTVSLTTDAGSAFMAMAAAHRLLGMDETTPGLVAIPEPESSEKFYRFPFKALSVDGVTVKNPEITLVGSSTGRECRPTLSLAADDTLRKCFGVSDVQLGMRELRALHIFMATKEKVLYASAAAPSSGAPRDITH